jgi:hypothetical protein
MPKLLREGRSKGESLVDTLRIGESRYYKCNY